MGRAMQRDWSSLPDLYSGGMNQEQLAQHFECSVETIRKVFKQLGLKGRIGWPKGKPWPEDGREERIARVAAGGRKPWTEARKAAHRAAIDSPTWRENNRQAFLRRLPLMRGPSANSPLERLLHGALMEAGIGFTAQHAFRVRSHKADVVDILITQAPIVIEADGTLHNLHKADDAERDAAIEAVGYRVYRFTGREINADPRACIARVIAENGLSPDVEPVYAVRNGMVGENNPHWSGGLVPWTCDGCGGTVFKHSTYRALFSKTFCDSKCYGRWLHEHPDQSPVHGRWAKDPERRSIRRDQITGRLIRKEAVT